MASQILMLVSDNRDPWTKLEANHCCLWSIYISPSEIREPKYFATPLHQSSRLSKYTGKNSSHLDTAESHDSTGKATGVPRSTKYHSVQSLGSLGGVSQQLFGCDGVSFHPKEQLTSQHQCSIP